MNYSLILKQELIQGVPKALCCRKAYAAGLFFDALEIGEGCLALAPTAAVARRECARVYREQYRREALLGGGALLFSSEKLYATRNSEPVLACAQCAGHFLRGLLIVCGSVTDPQKAYHLELRLANTERVPYLARFFEERGWHLGCRKIRGGLGLYSKNSTVIEELLTVTSAHQALFTMMNAKIAREIRNVENRATNCVARNIHRAVDAATRQCEAVSELIRSSRLEKMPPELQETARLRLENSEASLTELAQLHNPPITKSGLNHRLQKILEFASTGKDAEENRKK
ncbi:MAG: DNA-binding protein WhiA [Clostridia bacterium]|nr:DNA-binding protein WhiA [Clostridia bacterium]